MCGGDAAFYQITLNTGPAWRKDAKFRAVRHLSRRILDQSNNAIFTCTTCILHLPIAYDFIEISARRLASEN